jgi:hypothetical protein
MIIEFLILGHFSKLMSNEESLLDGVSKRYGFFSVETANAN